MPELEWVLTTIKELARGPTVELGFELSNPCISLLVWIPPLLQKRERKMWERKMGNPNSAGGELSEKTSLRNQ